jgi:hypothetical protein
LRRHSEISNDEISTKGGFVDVVTEERSGGKVGAGRAVSVFVEGRSVAEVLAVFLETVMVQRVWYSGK